MFFPDAAIAPSNRRRCAEGAEVGPIDLVFGDGIGLTFWINGVTSDGCCEFRGGPYLDTKYFGEGVGIAVKKGNRPARRDPQLCAGAGTRLRALRRAVLRYFPMSFFLAARLASRRG